MPIVDLVVERLMIVAKMNYSFLHFMCLSFLVIKIGGEKRHATMPGMRLNLVPSVMVDFFFDNSTVWASLCLPRLITNPTVH